MIIKIDISNKLNESKQTRVKKKKLNEGSSNGVFKSSETETVLNPQLGDSVMYKGMKGFITGAYEDKIIIAVQGSTYFCESNNKDLKLLRKPVETLKPPFKIDKKTQKVLFEQYVKCGVFMNNIPIKTSDCYVKYSDWRDAKLNENINVVIEGRPMFMERANIQIFENINEFANSDNYVEGVIINQETGEALENVLVDAISYTEAIGDADLVRVIRGHASDNPEDVEIDNLPKASIRTLSV